MKTICLAALALAIGSMDSAAAQQAPSPQPVPAAAPQPVPTAASPVTGTATLPDAQGNTTTVTSHLPAPPARDHRAIFEAMDVDHDGAISRREASGDKYLLRAYAALDTNGNRALDYQEMLRWLDD
jgi:hypothetical protein